MLYGLCEQSGNTYTRLRNVPMRTTPKVLSSEGTLERDAARGVGGGNTSEASSDIVGVTGRQGGQKCARSGYYSFERGAFKVKAPRSI